MKYRVSCYNFVVPPHYAFSTLLRLSLLAKSLSVLRQGDELGTLVSKVREYRELKKINVHPTVSLFHLSGIVSGWRSLHSLRQGEVSETLVSEVRSGLEAL